jgi:hypothetical protein
LVDLIIDATSGNITDYILTAIGKWGRLQTFIKLINKFSPQGANDSNIVEQLLIALVGAMENTNYTFINETVRFLAINHVAQGASSILYTWLYSTAMSTHNDMILSIVESYMSYFTDEIDVAPSTT